MALKPIRIVILAGGSGTRFWPAGRLSRPKQLLALDGDDTRPLLRTTVDRLVPLSPQSPWIVAPTPLKSALRRLLPELPTAAFLWEPRPRNTAAAVALAAYAARAEDREAPMLVVPADHHVEPVRRYRTALRAMATRARRLDGFVTLGLAPSRPATGYGYLQRGRRTARSGAGPFHVVEQYLEKPSAAKAKRFVAGGRHSWNGGTFAFRPSIFIAELERVLPDVAGPLETAFARYGTGRFRAALRKAYGAMPSISVDYGVMEQAACVEVLVSDIGWDDLGSWDAVARHRTPDEDGNRLRGDVTAVDSRNNVVDAEVGHVALLGVKDLIVVRVGDTTLVARRGKGEDVRKIVERLKEAGREDLLS